MTGILVPVSSGELLDKITILRIECECVSTSTEEENIERLETQLELSRRVGLENYT